MVAASHDLRPEQVPNANYTAYTRLHQCPLLQGGLDPNKISGLGVDFGHLVRCLLLGNKDAACKPSMIFR